MKSFSIISAVLFLVSVAYSQNKPELNVKFGGTVQAMARYSQTSTDTAEMSLGLRRVRIRMFGDYGEFIKSFIQFELVSPKLYDARIDYIVSDAFMVRLGRFKGAGVRACVLTSHTELDIVERPVSANYWGTATVGSDFRDYGIAFMGDVEGFHYNLTIHNGNGTANFKTSVASSSVAKDLGMAVSGMLFYKPPQLKGFEAGGYYGVGNKNINNYTSYNSYIYYEPLPYRLKAEVISVTNKNGESDTTALGYYVFGAFRFAQHFEGLARYEILDPNTGLGNDKQTEITFGLTYSVFPLSWETVKITGAYVIRLEETRKINNNIGYILVQTAL
jgi:hypothetical protein